MILNLRSLLSNKLRSPSKVQGIKLILSLILRNKQLSVQIFKNSEILPLRLLNLHPKDKQETVKSKELLELIQFKLIH